MCVGGSAQLNLEATCTLVTSIKNWSLINDEFKINKPHVWREAEPNETFRPCSSLIKSREKMTGDS